MAIVRTVHFAEVRRNFEHQALPWFVVSSAL